VSARAARTLGAALALLCAAGAAGAAPAARPATPAPRTAARRATPHAATPHAAASADSAGRGRSRVAPRTLDDIHIEGEIPVPQVLFITARDQRRFMEFQHHRYPRTSLELGRATPMPTGVVVTSPTPAERKEIQR